jgi:hypothetical protein
VHKWPLSAPCFQGWSGLCLLEVPRKNCFDGFVAPAISRERSCSIAARAVFCGAFGQKTDFTPHCLRDTFAVSLLQKGVPLEEVSKLLGHESIKTTEKSYAKWVQASQDRLDELVVGTWKIDTGGTGGILTCGGTTYFAACWQRENHRSVRSPE